MADMKQNFIVNIITKNGKKALDTLKQIRTQSSDAGTASLASGFDKAGKSADNFSKRAKGVAGATNNQTKAFSKMEQGISGGLVPAYATVAANVFALTAAFGALSRAADFQVLIDGAEELSAQTGRSLTTLAGQMQDITDGALNMKEALTSASIAASAGFDNSTIKDLTQVARNASVALGRDMTDAMNRVFKGAIKAEPELLDELGIILRLEPAVKKYAVSIGKSVAELTTFEKQQAVVNEVLAQGQEKFGTLGEIDTNKFAQLSATFSDLTNTALSFLNIASSPIIGFFADNITALAGAMLIFGNSVLKAAIPALSKFGEESQRIINKAVTKQSIAAVSTEALKDYKEAIGETANALGQVATQSRELVSGLIANSEKALGKNVYKKLITNLTKIKDPLQQMRAVVKTTDAAWKDFAKRQDIGSASWINQRDAIAEVNSVAKIHLGAMGDLVETVGTSDKKVGKLTTTYKNLSLRIGELKTAGIQGFFSGQESGLLSILKNYKVFNDRLKITVDTTTALGKSTAVAARGVFLLSNAFGSLLKALPFIGQLIIAWQLLGGAISFVLDIFRDGDAVEAATKAIEDQEKALKVAEKAANRYHKSIKNLPETIDNQSKKLTSQRNILQGLNSSLKDVTDNFEGFQTGIGADIDEFNDNLERQANILKELGAVSEVNKVLEKFGAIQGANKETSFELAQGIAKVSEELFKQKDAALEANTALDQTFKDLDDGFKDLQGSLPALSSLEKIFVNLSEALVRIDTINSTTISSLVQGMTTYSLTVAGVVDEVKNLSTLDILGSDNAKEIEIVNKRISELNQELRDIGHVENFLRDDLESVFSVFGGEELIRTSSDVNKELLGAKETLSLLQGTGDRVESSVTGNIDTIKKSFTELRNEIEESINSQNRLAAETQRLSFELSLPGLSAQKQLDITDKLTQANINSLNIVAADAERAATAIDKTIANIQGELDTLGTSSSTENLTRRNALEKELGQVLTQNLQIQKLIGDLEVQKNAARISQLNNLIKALNDASKAELKNIVETGSGEILERLAPVVEALGHNLTVAGESADEFKNRIVGILAASAEFEKINAQVGNLDQIQKSNAALSNRILAIQAEAQYLKDNNNLMDERLDKEFLLAEQQTRREISTLQDEALNPEFSDEQSNNLLNRIRELESRLELLGMAGSALVAKQIVQETKKAKIILDAKREELAFGRATTQAQKEQVKLAALEASLRAKTGNDALSTKEIKERLKVARELSQIEIDLNFQDQIDAVIPSVAALTDVFKELSSSVEAMEDPFDKASAGFIAAIKQSEKYGDTSGKAFGQISLSITNMLSEINKVPQTWKQIGVIVGDALTGIGSAISDAAGENEKQAKAGAYIEGIGAVIKAWNSAPFPYNIPFIAATVAGVNKLLGDMDAKSVSSDVAGQRASIEESFSGNGIQGVNTQSDSFAGKAVEQLVEVNSDLFSSTRNLQTAIVKLQKSFDNVAAQLFKQFRDFTDIGLQQSFGFTEGSVLTPGFFNDNTVTEELIAAGVEFGATIEFIGEEITGQIDKAKAFLIKQVTETDSGFLGFGGGTDVDIVTKFTGLDRSARSALGKTLDNTLEVVSGLVGRLGETIGISLRSLFDNASDVAISSTKIDLSGKSAEDQAASISAFFSHLSNEVIRSILPRLDKFSQAGEELTDTLARIIYEIQSFDNALLTIGTTLNNLVFNALTVDQLFEDFSTGVNNGINETVSSIEASIELLNESLTKAGRKSLAGSKKDVAALFTEIFDVGILKKGKIRTGDSFKKDILALIAEQELILQEVQDRTVKTFDDFTIDLLAAWNESLLENFKSIGDFEETFDRFSKALYSEAELAEIALQNATDTINRGFVELTTQLEALGETELLGALGNTASKEALRAFYELAEAQDLFAAKTNVATGEIDTSGATLFATLVQMGSAFISLEEAIIEADTAIEDFNRNILRQIQAFGLAGKELDNLQLDFEFEDAIKEATELGADIAKVEELYGLKRLDIIREYNQLIVDALDASSEGVANAILSIQRELESFNEVEFQTERINELWAEFDSGFAAAKVAAAAAVRVYNETVADNLEKELANKSSAINQLRLEGVLDNLRSQLDQEIDSLNNLPSVNELSSTINLINTNISRLTTSLAEAQAGFSSAEAGYEDIASTTYFKYSSRLQERAAEYETAMNTYQSQIDTISSQLASAESQKAEYTAQISNMDFIEQSLKDGIADIQQGIINAEKELDNIDFKVLEDAVIQQFDINVVEQIDVINQIKDAMIDRYRAELEMVEEVENVAIDIKQFLKDLAISDVSPLTSMERLTSAQNNFSDNLRNIFHEDSGVAADARNNLLDSASVLLEEASGVFAIGSEYQDIYNFVTRSLENLDPQVNAEIEATDIDKLRIDTIAELQTLDSVLYELEAFNDQQLNAEILALGETLIPHLDNITLKLDELNDSTWIPIKNALMNLSSYDIGTDEVKQDQLAKIHKGEMIINPETAGEVREGGAVITNIDNSSSQTMGGSDNTEVVVAINNLTEALVTTQEDIIDLQERILLQENEPISLMPAIKTVGVI